MATAIAIAGSVTYEYNELGRLKSVTESNGRQTVYVLDAAGNRVSRTTSETATARSPPGSLSANAVSSTQVNLSWVASTDNIGVASYSIYQNGSTNALTSVNAPATTFSDTGLTPSTPYTYTVKAFDLAGNPSSASNQAGATTQAPPPPRGAAVQRKQLPGSRDAGTVTINVTRTGGSAGAAAVNYATSPGTAAAGSDYTHKTGTLNWAAGDAANNTFTVTLPNDFVYEGNEAFNLTLSGASGASLGAQTSSTVTIQDDKLPDTTPPSVPAGLSLVSSSSAHVTFSWNPSSDTGGSGLAGYKIYKGGSPIGTSGTNSFTDNSVSGTTNYSYRVSAYDNATPPNESAQSTPLSVTTPDTIPPTAPTLTATVIAYNRVDLSWTPSTDSGGSGLNFYWIYRNGSYLWDTSLSGPITSYSDLTTAQNTTYTYTVVAQDHGIPPNVSPASNGQTVTTPSAPPAPPPGAPGWTNGWAGCVGPAGCQDLYSSFTLNWAVTSGGTPDRYELQRSTNGGGAWALAHSGTLTSNFLALSIPVNQVHHFRVRGCNVQAGCGAYSTVIILWHNPNP